MKHMHGIATRKPSVCHSVRPFVRLSVKRVDCDRTNESCASILIAYEKRSSWVSDTENGWWGDPLCLKFWAKLTPFEQNADFNRNSLVALQP